MRHVGADRGRELASGFAAAWNQHDRAALGRQFHDDATFVSMAGSCMRGRAEIERQHATVPAGPYRDATLHVDVEDARELAPGVIVAHLRAEHSAPRATTPPGDLFVVHGELLGHSCRERPRGMPGLAPMRPLVVVAIPGTGAVYTISAGLSRGARPSIVAAFGCTQGVLPHMVAAITGLAAPLNASAQAFQAIKWLGVAYLLYLAWQTWRDKSELTVDDAPAPASAGRVILTAVLINLLNPKLTIFFFAFLPQLVPGSEPNAWLRMTGLGLVFMAITFIVFALYGIFAATMRRQVLARPCVVTWMRRTFAATYLLLAGRLAVANST